MRITRKATIASGTPLAPLYRELGMDYPKFFKMDTLCKVGLLASEQLLRAETGRFVPREDRAVVLFGRCGSRCNDRHYLDTLSDFPSPALFVYTLPNIVGAEIAIRNKYEGETGAILMERRDERRMMDTLQGLFQDSVTTSVLSGWIDCPSDDQWECELFLIEKQ